MSSTTLVVGATGQVGSLIVAELARQGLPARAMSRRPDETSVPDGVDVVRGDLRDISSLRDPVRGCDTIIATATAATPRKGDSVRAVDDQGYANLLAVAATSGVHRFVFTSVAWTTLDDAVPVARAKRATETRLTASGLDYRVLRFPMFMEFWLALVGSSIPLRGEAHATLDRPFGLATYRKVTGHLVEGRGTMLVPGPASNRHAFISVRDVARLLVAAAQDGALANTVTECGGPEILTWTDVAEIFSEVLGRPVKVSSTPARVFAVMQRVLAPLNPGAANIMGLNRMAACSETAWPPPPFAARLGVTPAVTVRQLLTEKAALAAGD